jgi:hypothetical protein
MPIAKQPATLPSIPRWQWTIVAIFIAPAIGSVLLALLDFIMWCVHGFPYWEKTVDTTIKRILTLWRSYFAYGALPLIFLLLFGRNLKLAYLGYGISGAITGYFMYFPGYSWNYFDILLVTRACFSAFGSGVVR